MNWIKPFWIISLLTALTLEGSSILASKAGLLLFNDPPAYTMQPPTGLNWRNEKYAWGTWHKTNATDRHVSRCFDVRYQSNDVGARDSDDYKEIDGGNNVAVLGDSFVEGYGIDLDQTFARMLEHSYGKKGLNFGATGAFGPVQQYLIYDGLVSQIPHNEIVYFFLPANDFSDNADTSMDSFAGRFRPYFTKAEPVIEDGGNDSYQIIYPPDATPSDSYPSGMFGGPNVNYLARI